MQSNVQEESKPMNQWVEFNRLLFIYKTVAISFAVLALFLTILSMVLSGRKPIVVVSAFGDNFYAQGEKKEIALDEGNIKRFVETFVMDYYDWKILDPDQITRTISPLVTDGFRSKALDYFKNRRDKDFPGKKISQGVAGLDVKITKDATIAVFDVVLHVDGIPLVVPYQVSLQLIQQKPTQWNPVGLFVNGITVHEGK